MRARGRLLAAAFAPTRVGEHLGEIATQHFDTPSDAHVDLLEKLNLAGQAAGVHAWDWDIAAGALKYDHHGAQRYGGNAKEVARDPRLIIENGVFKDDQPRYRAEFIKALKGETPLCIDYRIIYQDGSIHPVQLRGEIFRGPDRRATRVVGLVIDMSAHQAAAARIATQAEEQQRAQLKIETQARQLQAWIEKIQLANETAGVGMWDWDLTTGKLSSDLNMATIFPNANLSGLTRAQDFVDKILHPDDREPFLGMMNQAIARGGGERVATHFRYIGNDDSVQHIELQGRIVRDEKGRALRFLGISWNITQRVQAEEEIKRQSEAQRVLIERLNLATEVASIDVWDWDLLTDRIVADTFLTDAYGGKHFEIAGARQIVANIVHPEDAAGYFQALDRAIVAGATFFHRYRMILRDGTQRHVQVNARVFRNADGKATRLLGVSQNVTEEMQHMDELRRQAVEERALRDRLNLATHTAGIAIWDKDLVNGAFVCNEQFWNMFGLPRDDRFKVHYGIHPEVREQTLAPLNIAFADPKCEEILAVRHRTSNPRPEPQYVQTHMRVFRDANGKAIRLLGVTWDVTEIELNAAELKRKADQERALVERLNVVTRAAGISPWEFDLKTNRFSWHGQRQECYGLDDVPLPEYMEALYELVLEEDRPQLSEPAKLAVESGNPDYSYDFRVRGKDGQIHHMRNKARMMRNVRGKFRYIMGVTMDVSKEVEANALLEQRAEENAKLVDRLSVATQAAGISPWEFDLKHNCFSWFGSRPRILGLDNEPPETYMQALRSLVVEEDLPILSEAPQQALADGVDHYTYRYRARGIDDKIHHFKTFVRIVRSARGTPYRLVGVTWDISEEIAANELLKQQAEHERQLTARLNIATESAGISSWEIDLVERQFLWIENPLKRLSGIRGANGKLATFAQRVHPEDINAMRDEIRRAAKGGYDVINYRYRGLAHDDSIVHVQCYAKLYFNEARRALRILGVSWDVTDEMAANEKLQQQAQNERELLERLNVATQGAGVSLWEFDLKLNHHTWYSKRLAILGMDDVPVEEYYNELHKRMHPEDWQTFVNVPREAVLAGKENYSCRFRVQGVNGQPYVLQNYARILRSPRGTAYRFVGVTWDVTREVDAASQLEEQAQKERELTERLSIATSAAGISTWEIDIAAGKFMWVENSLTATDGASGSAHKIATFAERIHPDDKYLFRDSLRAAVKEGRDIVSYRYRYNRLDGRVTHIQAYAKLFFGEDSRRAIRALGASWDVSKEVEATEQLQQRAQHERELMERLNIATSAANIASWEIDLIAGRFLWIENPIENMTRGADGRIALEEFEQFVVPEDRRLMQNAIRAAMAAGSDRVKLRYRTNGNDGSIYHLQSFARLIVNPEGRPLRLLGVTWDVTREVQAAEQLQRQAERLSEVERRLERASLSSSEGHWEVELATGHLWCSSSFHTLLGYRSDELEARVSTFDLLIHQDDRLIYGEALRAHLVDESPYDVELRMRMVSGAYRWFHMRGTAERNARNEPVLMAGSIHDIHQQKITEDALRLAQRRFERAINGTQDGLWELDVATDTIWCSPRLALLLGYTSSELSTNNFLRSLIHDDDAPKLANVTIAHYRDSTPFDLEIRLKTRNGDYRWYRARATAERDAAGRALRLSGSLQDVTEARAAREELVRAIAAAEAASLAKSAFLANVSHEIRTPMNGIVGMTGLLLDTTLDRTQRDFADTIRASADSLLIIINDILDFSKIEAGKLDLENIELDLRANVEDVAAMMAFQAASKGLELIVNVHPEVPERVKGDPQRLRQCLVNLVGNAIKFTKTGEIVIDVCAVGRHDGRVLTHFEVRDTGLGIAQDTLKTLFQPFVQADSSTTRHFGGTGLGLSIVRKLVEMMGGQVGVVSEIGKGSNFFFTLSLEPVDQVSAASRATTAAKGGRILIVDDNDTNRRVLNLQLTHAGYRVDVAASGAKALSLMHQASEADQPFDLVVTDFQMPDMDGAMLATHIGEEPSFSSTRLIMLTSLDQQGDTQRLAELGFAAYLTKPVRARELVVCVARVLAAEARQWQMEIRPMITRNTLSQSGERPHFQGRVLLVEDNLVNQKVAARFLERLGCSVSIAEHGEAGVAMFTNERFDMILMDLQMPVMDGLSATRRIRDLEGADPKLGRTPIIALTANAMRGDQERCESAGMDGYLTKPIEVDRLRDILEKFGLSRNDTFGDAAQIANAIQAPEQTPTTNAPIDLARLNAIVNGDVEFQNELIETFFASGAQLLADLNSAIATLDRTAIAQIAHKLKGACGNIHARTLLNLALELETSAIGADSVKIDVLRQRLQSEFRRARDFLSDPLVTPGQARAAS